MHVQLNYGCGKLGVELPDALDIRLINKKPMPLLDDPATAMELALDAPVSVPPLAKVAADARTACILICDITRPVPNRLILGPLVRKLISAGLAPDAIKILVATGLHRPNEGAELAELIGDDWVLETIGAENHFARDNSAHVEIGRTSRDTVVKLDRRFVEADIKIATGLVEPHFMAGWSGGRKVISPGIAHRETITTLHSALYMEDPRCASCVLDGNPLHEDQIEIVKMLGGALAVNTVVDEERRLAFLNYGEIIASHQAAIDFANRYTVVPVADKFSTVVTSAAGYPLDKTYYQTIKGMVGPMDILKPGGNIIIVSECSEGMGSPDFVAAQRRLMALGPEGFLKAIKGQKYAEIDEWQTEMQLKPMRQGQIKLYTDGLEGDDRGLTSVEMINSVEDAVAASVAQTGDNRVAVMPEGPYVVAAYRPEAV